jgi:DNA-binding transcriptional MerR regulator
MPLPPDDLRGAPTPKTALSEKQFFKIGEAAELIGVKAHVLRYWESEFPGLKPLKTRGAHRMYRRADVELACLIRRLLHQEGYTIPGAKKRVRELIAQRAEAAAHTPSAKTRPLDSAASRELGLRAELIQVRAELAALLASLDRPAEGETAAAAEEDVRVTVTAVVPKTSLLQRRTR